MTSNDNVPVDRETPTQQPNLAAFFQSQAVLLILGSDNLTAFSMGATNPLQLQEIALSVIYIR